MEVNKNGGPDRDITAYIFQLREKMLTCVKKYYVIIYT